MTPLNRSELLKAIQDHSVRGAYLFEGEEEHFKAEALTALRKAILPEGMEDLNETIMENPDTDAVIAAAETLPFLTDQRLIILRDHPALSGRSEADEKLLSYLPQLPSSAVLVFYCTGKPDGRKKLYTTLKKVGTIVTFSPIKGAELTTWVTKTFKEAGKECDSRTADFLIFTCGQDTNQLSREIAKIAAYHPEEPRVSPDDVKALATPSTECTVFEMVDAVVTGQNTKAITLMRNQLRNGSDRVFMISMLLRQYKILQHIKIMQYEKKPVAYISKNLGVPPFAVDQYMRQASGYNGGQIKKAVSLCLDMEYAVKSGRINQEGSLEALLLQLHTLKTAE